MEQRKKDLVDECKKMIEHSPLFGTMDFLTIADRIISQSPNYYDVGEIFSVIYMDLKGKAKQKELG